LGGLDGGLDGGVVGTVRNTLRITGQFSSKSCNCLSDSFHHGQKEILKEKKDGQKEMKDQRRVFTMVSIET